ARGPALDLALRSVAFAMCVVVSIGAISQPILSVSAVALLAGVLLLLGGAAEGALLVALGPASLLHAWAHSGELIPSGVGIGLGGLALAIALVPRLLRKQADRSEIAWVVQLLALAHAFASAVYA